MKILWLEIGTNDDGGDFQVITDNLGAGEGVAVARFAMSGSDANIFSELLYSENIKGLERVVGRRASIH